MQMIYSWHLMCCKIQGYIPLDVPVTLYPELCASGQAPSLLTTAFTAAGRQIPVLCHWKPHYALGEGLILTSEREAI